MALTKSSTIIPLAACEKILRKSGNERISDSAKKTMCKELEKIAFELAKKANLLSIHAGRKTVQDKDIELAFKDIRF